MGDLKIEKKLQQLALRVANDLDVTTLDAVGIVSNSEIGIKLKDGMLPESLSDEELAESLLEEVRMAV